MLSKISKNTHRRKILNWKADIYGFPTNIFCGRQPNLGPQLVEYRQFCCTLSFSLDWRWKCEGSSPNKFFTANILFLEHLGVICFRPKKQSFLQEKASATFSYGQGTHSTKMMLIVWPKISQMPQKMLTHFVCPSPKVFKFWKKSSLWDSSPSSQLCEL